MTGLEALEKVEVKRPRANGKWNGFTVNLESPEAKAAIIQAQEALGEGQKGYLVGLSIAVLRYPQQLRAILAAAKCGLPFPYVEAPAPVQPEAKAPEAPKAEAKQEVKPIPANPHGPARK